MPLKLSPPSIRSLPLFFAYCPDRAGAYLKRLEVRAKHLERWNADKEKGIGEFGLGFLPPPNSPPLFPPSSASQVPPNSPPLAGSLMIFRSESLDKAWDRIREDLYWTEGVWEREGVRVERFTQSAEWMD